MRNQRFFGEGIDEQILLSVCVPTYNRSHEVVKNVKKAIETPIVNIEIIISDNGSDDDTLEQLSKIEDKRLTIISNDRNRGFAFNFYKIISEAKGLFCLVLSDEDELIIDSLESFIKTLSENLNVGVIYPAIRREGKGLQTYTLVKCVKIKAGETGIKRFLYTHSYLSGIVINKLNFLDFSHEQEEWYNIDEHYPHEYMVYRLVTEYGGLLTKKPLVLQHKSSNKTYGNAAYDFQNRFITMCARFNTIKKYPVEGIVDDKLIIETYKNFLYGATVVPYKIQKSKGLKKIINIEGKVLKPSIAIEKFLDMTIEFCKQKGYVSNTIEKSIINHSERLGRIVSMKLDILRPIYLATKRRFWLICYSPFDYIKK